MSNEGGSNRVLRPSEPQPAQPSGLRADADLLRETVRRIETAIRDDYATLPSDFLRAHLRALSDTVAQGRLAIALDAEYGSRTVEIDRLLADLAIGLTAAGQVLDPPGGASLPAAAALSIVAAPVPAVPDPSEAVEHAIPAEATLAPPAAEPDPVAREPVPTVSGIVARAGRSIAALMPLPEFGGPPTDDPPTEAATEASVARLQSMVEALSTPAAEMEAWRQEFAPDVSPPATAESPQPVAAEPATAPGPDLISSFERMQATPYLAPEEGAAVIFPPRDPDEPRPDASASAPVPPPSAAICAPRPDGPAPVPEQEVATFLFGVNDAEPKEFLLDLSGLASEAAAEPMASADPQPEAMIMPEVATAPPMTAAPVEPTAVSSVRDPLAAVRSMSDVERIALFG